MSYKQYMKLTKRQLVRALFKSVAHDKKTVREIESALYNPDLPDNVLHHLNHILVSYGREPIVIRTNEPRN